MTIENQEPESQVLTANLERVIKLLDKLNADKVNLINQSFLIDKDINSVLQYLEILQINDNKTNEKIDNLFIKNNIE